MKSYLPLALALSLAPVAAFAKEDPKQCKADCREFQKECEEGCKQQLKKKDPKSKLQDACTKNCADFVKECEKECDHG
jgi:hypothetical protein